MSEKIIFTESSLHRLLWIVLLLLLYSNAGYGLMNIGISIV